MPKMPMVAFEGLIKLGHFISEFNDQSSKSELAQKMLQYYWGLKNGPNAV